MLIDAASLVAWQVVGSIQHRFHVFEEVEGILAVSVAAQGPQAAGQIFCHAFVNAMAGELVELVVLLI